MSDNIQNDYQEAVIPTDWDYIGTPDGDLVNGFQTALHTSEQASSSASSSAASAAASAAQANAILQTFLTQPGAGAPVDATTLIKGVIKLAGDLGGTADLPTVTGAVRTTGNQTVDGVKTYLLGQIVPDATVGKNPTTKDQLDAAITALSASIGSSTIVDATTTVKGKLKLAGDLSGTADLPIVVGLSAAIAAIALKANAADAALTGNPTAPTQTSTDNTTKIATTAFVQSNNFVAYGVRPAVEWTGSAWPARSSKIPLGYTGGVQYLSPLDSTVVSPTDRLLNDWWMRKRS
jgi:hypothetical protein